MAAGEKQLKALKFTDNVMTNISEWWASINISSIINTWWTTVSITDKANAWWNTIKETAQTIGGTWTFSGVVKQKLTNFDVYTAPVSSSTHVMSYIQDKNDVTLGAEEALHLADNTIERRFGMVIRAIGASMRYCFVSTKVASDGTRSISLEATENVTVNTPSDESNGKQIASTAWVRTRISNWWQGLTNGLLRFYNNIISTTGLGFCVNLSNIATGGHTPSSSQWRDLSFKANDGAWLGGCQLSCASTGENVLVILARKKINGEDVTSSIYLGVNATGGRWVTLGYEPNVASCSLEISTTSFVRQLISKTNRVGVIYLDANGTVKTVSFSSLLAGMSYTVVFTYKCDSSSTSNSEYIRLYINGIEIEGQLLKHVKNGLHVKSSVVTSSNSGVISVGCMTDADYGKIREVKVEAFMN